MGKFAEQNKAQRRVTLLNAARRTVRTLYSKCGGYMGGRLLFLPGEVWRQAVINRDKFDKTVTRAVMYG